MSKSIMNIISIICFLSLFLMLNEVNCCFITNCPPAGKRSMMSSPSSAASLSSLSLTGPNHINRECTRCGPSLIGRCYGPNICCSPLLGCNIGGFGAQRCSLEAYHPTLCVNPGPNCGPNGKGVCALNSTCCTNDGCFMDKSCSVTETNEIPN